MNKDKIEMDEILEQINNLYKRFIRLYEFVEDKSALFLISCQADNNTGNISVGVAGNNKQLTETLYRTMKRDNAVAGIVMAAGAKFARDKMENEVPELLSKALRSAFGECNCPECTAERKKKNTFYN